MLCCSRNQIWWLTLWETLSPLEQLPCWLTPPPSQSLPWTWCHLKHRSLKWRSLPWNWRKTTMVWGSPLLDMSVRRVSWYYQNWIKLRTNNMVIFMRCAKRFLDSFFLFPLGLCYPMCLHGVLNWLNTGTTFVGGRGGGYLTHLYYVSNVSEGLSLESGLDQYIIIIVLVYSCFQRNHQM